MSDNLRKLHEAGVSVWLDGLDRDLLSSGRLAELVRDKYVVGVTTDPTGWRRTIVGDAAYEDQLRVLARQDVTAEEAVRTIVTDDVRAAADVLRPVFDATDGRDGSVSLQLDPRIAFRSDPMANQAKELLALIDRPNVVFRIPCNEAGYYAIPPALAAGVSIDATHLVSHVRYRMIIDGIMTGYEKALENGLDLAKINTITSYFLGRVDVLADQRLREVGTPETLALVGKGALENARLTIMDYDEFFGNEETGRAPSERWAPLAAAGARPPRLQWGSMTVRNPDIGDTTYVEGLVAPGLATAMTEETLEAFDDHGVVAGPDTIRPHLATARETITGLRAIGHRVTVQTLEEEMVLDHRATWNALLDWTAAELEKLRADR